MEPDAVRQRFDELTRDRLLGPLAAGVEVMAPPHEDWLPRMKEIHDAVSLYDRRIDMERVFDEEERARQRMLERTLDAKPLRHELLFMAGEEVAGTYLGYQEQYFRYYMCFTLLKPEWRGRGIYSAFLRKLLPLLAETGFREVYSRHHADNNAVLVPKLKAGFLIVSMEISPNHGMLVHLRYPLSERWRQLHQWRIQPGQVDRALWISGVLRDTPED